MPAGEMIVSYETETVSGAHLPDLWKWNENDVSKALPVGTALKAVAEYTGEDAANYENQSVEISVTRAECRHSLTETKAQAASCTVSGNSAFWTCSKCGRFFSDADGVSEIEKDSRIIAQFAVEGP